MAEAATKEKKGGRKRARAVKEGKLDVCGAIKQNGQPCLRDKGWGTDHQGEGRCRYHPEDGDTTPMGAAGRELAAMATPIETDPVSAISGILNLSAGQLTYTTMKVADLREEDLFGESGINVWVRWQERLMNQTAKFANIAAAMGIEERRVKIAEIQTTLMTRMIEAVVGELDLTPAQRKKVGPAIRKALPVIAGTGTEKN